MFTQNVIIPIMINITIVILYYYYILLVCVIILNVISAFHIFIYSFVFNSYVILFYYAWSTPPSQFIASIVGHYLSLY